MAIKMTSGSNLSINQTLTSIKCNEDIFTEILFRLPLKTLLKSRSVCKWWSHLISSPAFIANYSLRNPDLHVSGLLVQKFLLGRMNSNLKFIDFNDAAMFRFSLSFIEDEYGIHIQHSSNGLLLCSSLHCQETSRIYYICQPMTKQYFTIPRPESKFVYGINIAFDPFKSSFIRVVCVVPSDLRNHYQVKIYTSDEKLWRESGKPFVTSDVVLFHRGVFWNGSLHWVSRGDTSLRFDVERELLLEMPMPSKIEGQSERQLGYFGVSGDHLYMVHIYDSLTTVFDVMEMKSDYSGWFVKYHIDLNVVAIHYRTLLDQFSFSIMHIDHQCRRKREVVYDASAAEEPELDQEQEEQEQEQDEHGQDPEQAQERAKQEGEEQAEEEEEELCTMLQFHIPGKLISYDIENMTFVELQDLSSEFLWSEFHLQSEYSWDSLHPYVSTLYYI